MAAPGERFAHYELEQVAGAGSSAVVYRARDSRLGRTVALKLIAPQLAADPLVRERLNREATLAAQVDHPHVVPVFEAGEHDGTIFLARRWIDGVTLAELVREDGPLELGRAVRLLVQVAEALQAVHDSQLVHRDLTPGNVLVDARDDAHLTDFGITRRATDATGLTGPEQLLGTLDYVAPEQIAGGTVGRHADLYSLGCLGWFLLCGEPPFPRDGHAAKLYAHLAADCEPLAERRPDVPAALDELLRAAMAKEPERRPPSAAAFAEALAAALDDAGAAPGGTPAPLPGRSPAPLPGDPPDATPAAPPRARVPAAAAHAPVVPRRGRARRWATALAGTAAAALLLAAPAVLYLGLSRDAAGSETLQLSHRAASIAAAGPGVAVGGPDGSITLLADGRRRLMVLGGSADRVAAAGASIYAAGGRALTIAPAGGRGPARRIALAAAPAALAADGRDGVWVALAGGAGLVHVLGGRSTAAPEPGRFTALAVAGGVLWAADARAGTVQRLSAVDGRPLSAPRRVGGRPVALAAGGGAVWVVDGARNVALRLDPRSGRPAGVPIPVAPRPVAVAADARSAWVLSSASRVVTRIDARSGRPAQTEGVPPGADGVALAGGAAWVSVADGRVVRVPRR